MLEPNRWFTEIDEDNHSAFSLKITRKLHEEQTPFQKIEIYETVGFGNLMVIDGFVMLSSRDNFLYHEMMTHPVLYSHPDPKRVWIIGGGDCGSLQETLKHPEVESAIQIEIDERVTRLSEEYFPELCQANGDPRAQLKFEDGIQWVREAPSGSVDVIIVDSTDPLGPGEGLFTEGFYRDCLRCLGDNGLLIQQSESPLFHPHILHPMRKAMKAAGFREVKTLFFPQPVYPSGWWSGTVAAKTAIGSPREADILGRPFPTRYYNLDIHRAAFAAPNFFLEATEREED
ncbi:spermidine synthase [Methylomarinovum caldicuralii]|uniref:Polyamine aminopropyltransferase n=1 Tax=Methylomarinovum caldicuralii TaxID=438856 RepID=A0AAU9C2H8_9GAMM|nr:polyamine aminopropyltransferase [Methylomarinovum caldicuralii]BCX81375.1 spermidine synthase [Methylomarinovum caldicuralii]